MSIHGKHLIRYGLVLLGIAAVVGCEGPSEPDLGGISLSIITTGATVVQGGSQPVSATLTRTGGFSGTVDLTVTGTPSGVTAAVSNVQTTGAVTTATFTIVVGPGVTPARYPLVVHGTGSGVREVTQVFPLTVTAPPAVPGYTLSLTAPSLSLAQGEYWSHHAMYLVRTNFTGDVTLSVENLPAGVDAFFYPSGSISGDSPELWLYVAGDAVPGTYTNLLVRGVAAGLADRTAPLSLTIRVAPFALMLSSPTLSIAPGGVPQATTVYVARHTFTGPVTLEVDENPEDGYPAGVTTTLAPNPVTVSSAVLTVSVDAAAVPGVYTILVSGRASTGVFWAAELTLTVTAVLGTQAIEQWATTASASSEDTNFEARLATGAPDGHAWAGYSDWLELTYPTPVQPTMIRVYETGSLGCIVRVEVKDAAGQYTTIYAAQVTFPEYGSPHTLEIPVIGGVRISAVRISLDNYAHEDWSLIDAVQLVGRP
jgi:hypothetical protein